MFGITLCVSSCLLIWLFLMFAFRVYFYYGVCVCVCVCVWHAINKRQLTYLLYHAKLLACSDVLRVLIIKHIHQQQTFGDTSECSAASVILLLVIAYAAFRPVSSARLAQIDGVRVVRVVVVGQNAWHTALAEILTCRQRQQRNKWPATK